MKKNVLFVLLLIVTSIVKSQSLEYVPYEFKSLPYISENEDEFRKKGSWVLYENRIHEFYYNVEGTLEVIEIFHATTKVYTQKAVDENNKIYIRLKDVKEIVDIKARFISKDNKITEVDKKNIKTVENLDEKGDYKVFAIEGAEVEGIIDYYYVLRKEPDLFTGFYVQSNEPKRRVEISMIMPQNLRMISKSYNGFPELKDTIIDTKDKRFLTVVTNNIPALEEEPYSNYKANLMRFEYVFCYNYSKNRSRFYTFNDAARTYYERLINVEKNEKKAVKRLVSDADISSKLSTEEKVRKLEVYVKTHIAYKEKSGDVYENLESVLQNNHANSVGFVKIFLHALSQMSIDAQPLMTCDRDRRVFDKDFDTWNYLDEFLIYIPEIKKYLVPDDWSYRLGLIPIGYSENYGLYFKSVKVGDLESFVPETKKIPGSTYKENSDSLFLEVALTDEFSNTHLKLRRVMAGYLGKSLQTFYKLLEGDDRQEILKQYAALGNESSKLDKVEVKNTEPEDFFVKPVEVKCELDNTGFVEKAGTSILMKVGEMIGPQSELYNENKQRVQEVDINNPHYYYRVIKIEIPKGYKIDNLKELEMNVNTNDGTNPTAAFVSTVRQEGNYLVLEINEYYTKLKYPATMFNSFRNVINAAADYNKKTLILTEL